MSRFNTPTLGTKTTNLARGDAYSQTPELELVSILLTSTVRDQYYRSADDGILKLRELLTKVAPKLAAKAAVYFRFEFGLRSISHVLAAELAKHASGKTWAKDFYKAVVRRPDDMTEIIAYYKSNLGKSLPSAMSKGFAKAFDKFDEYQLAKYRGKGKSVKLIDVVNLVRPIPVDKNKTALKKLVEGTLTSTKTWEAKLTATKGDKDAKDKAWSDLVLEGTIGYFALLRNLRNILQQSPKVIDAALKMLRSERLIKKSLIFPHQFVSAYVEIQKLGGIEGAVKVMDAIDDAIDIAVNNVPVFEGKTLVVADFSGSMGSGITSYKGIASLFGTILAKSNDADFMYFGNSAKYSNFSQKDSTMGTHKYLMGLNEGWGSRDSNYVGHGTNFGSIFEAANKAYERIVIFSDMQGWQNGLPNLNPYKQKFGIQPHIYSIDLTGYGTMQFPENKVYCLAGFSDKIFDLMSKLEQDRKVLLNTISNYEF